MDFNTLPNETQTVFFSTWNSELSQLLVILMITAGSLRLFRPNDLSIAKSSLFLLIAALLSLLFSGLAMWLEYYLLSECLHEAAVFTEGVVIIRLCGSALFRWLLPLCRIGPPRIIEDIVVCIGYCVWLVVRLHYAGVNMSGIVTTSAVITGVLAFSMQETLVNILGGLSIQLDNSIRIGDWISTDEVEGKVVEIRWRYTAVETRNWETLIIPNSLLMKSKLSVLGRRANQPLQWRRWIWFQVGYEAFPGLVINTVQKAIRENNIANVAMHPAPNCLLMDFEGGSARYALRYWLTDPAMDSSTDSDVRTHIFVALQRADIHFAFPEYLVHMEKGVEKHELAKKAQHLQNSLTTLQNLELFRSLHEDELITIAKRLKYTPFIKGSRITRQGNVANWLYILVSGEADVFLESKDGSLCHLTKAFPGQFFGEMGLMTGEPRSATIIATTDVICYRLDKASFQEVLQKRPELADEFGRILALRRCELDNAQSDLDAATRNQQLEQQQRSLTARIRGFFSLVEQ